MIQRTRLVRQAALRDARLFLVGVEGEVTEPLYFDGLQRHGVFRSGVHVQVLPTERGESAPSAVVDRVDAARSAIDGWRDMDACWVVIDRDRWKDKMLAEVATLCAQKDYGLALSNPCFELWLALHHADVEARTTKDELVSLLKTHTTYANDKRIDPTAFTRAHVESAIERADALDSAKHERWPSKAPGTHVYKLARELLAPR